MKQILSITWELGKIALVAFVLVVGLRFFIFQPFLVRGESMEPNFHNWDYLIVDEISYRFNSPERGDVIVFNYPNDPSQRYIKRIIGLPGETIQVSDGRIRINEGDEFVTLDEAVYLPNADTTGTVKKTLLNNEYFVMGDNRQFSSDSRHWGPLAKEHIIGKVFIRVFPISAFAKMEAPEYTQ